MVRIIGQLTRKVGVNQTNLPLQTHCPHLLWVVLFQPESYAATQFSCVIITYPTTTAVGIVPEYPLCQGSMRGLPMTTNLAVTYPDVSFSTTNDNTASVNQRSN